MLSGFTIGITADRRWEEQASLFERRGASVLHGPAIRTLSLDSDATLRTATDAVITRRPSLVIANTGLGIRSWFSAADTWGVGDALNAALADARIYARGPKAAGALHAHGLEITGRAPTERLREAVDLALLDLRPGDAVALVLDGGSASMETERLRATGADVIEVPVYRWELPDDPGPALRLAEAVIAGRVHAVTFTSAPAVGNWFAMADGAGIGDDLRDALGSGRVVVGCVGPVCAEAVTVAGVDSPDIVVPAKWRLGPLVRVVAERLAERALVLNVHRSSVVVQGNVVTIDGEPVVLTATEAQLLTVLATRPNVVHSKPDLLRLVWRDETVDPHVVEVAITRIRRRVGPLGDNIASVYRRGYVLKT